MTIRLSRATLVVLGLAVAAAVAAFAIAGSSHASPTPPTPPTPPVVTPPNSPTPPKPAPISLHGKFSNIMNFFPPACTSVTQVCSSFVATGDIVGSGIVDVDTYPDATTGFSAAHTTITTAQGILGCNEGAIFQPTVPVGQTVHAFVDLCVIDPNRSTGKYAGATGYIQEVGTFDFAAGVGSLDYYGKLVFGNP
jgi:hypothetical protein